ncbi:hypothetical protein [Kribbella sp. NPDC048928]|uniref:hypothetical protein n=1 Tax=Kribbella sp. NPDC048928 TaxID=3364111 RepID=UPI00371481B9
MLAAAGPRGLGTGLAEDWSAHDVFSWWVLVVRLLDRRGGGRLGCPIFPDKRYEDRELTDPTGRPIEIVRQVRDEIRTRVEKLLTELGS